MIEKSSNKLIRGRVLKSNVEIHNLGLVIQSFGNASGRDGEYCFIKPSGVNINSLKYDEIVKIKLSDSEAFGKLRPSSDTPTHVKLYNAFSEIGGVVHTHSTYATAWAQSNCSIPCIGTTHADYWGGDIPITRDLTEMEIVNDYEKDTGSVIIEKIRELSVSPLSCPGVLVANHGPFAWGKNIEDAVKNAEILEYCAKLAWLSLSINPNAKTISSILHNKHHSRKHGPDAYYGQDHDK